jgi:hypothetical protein
MCNVTKCLRNDAKWMRNATKCLRNIPQYTCNHLLIECLILKLK